VVFAVKPVTLEDNTLPTFRPLNPVTNVAKVLLVDTSKRYPDKPPPVLAAQLAVKLLEVRLVVERVPGMDGAAANVKVPELVPVPELVITETVPVVPEPITATICEPVLDVMEETAVPPILTFAAVAPVKFVPLIVMVDPGQPEVGVNEVTVGGETGADIDKLEKAEQFGAAQ
jgi:hypothetical protein